MINNPEDPAVSKKYLQIMASAHKLFWAHGIRRVTIEEVCRHAQVSKMTFYKYFSNKDDLALKVVTKVIEEAEKKYFSIVEQGIAYTDKIDLIVKLKLEQTGELSKEMLADLWTQQYPAIAEFIEQKKVENFRIFIEDIKKHQEKGEIRQDLKPEFLLYMLNKMIEMMDDENLMRLYKSTPELVAELVNYFFYGLMPPQGKKNA